MPVLLICHLIMTIVIMNDRSALCWRPFYALRDRHFPLPYPCNPWFLSLLAAMPRCVRESSRYPAFPIIGELGSLFFQRLENAHKTLPTIGKSMHYAICVYAKVVKPKAV